MRSTSPRSIRGSARGFGARGRATAFRLLAVILTLLAYTGCSRLTFLPENFQHLPGQGLAKYASLPNINLEGFLPGGGPSLKFAVIGDSGSGTRRQYEIGQRMAEYRKSFPFDTVLMVGDNIYGGQTPRDYVAKFEQPYKPLLDGGVKFYAALGNHDSREQRLYKPFNMNGKTYYSFKASNQDVRFFVLETDYMDAKQLAWIENELKTSKENWKICYFHHPLYSSARYHGSDLALREVLEPLFVKYNVSVVFYGHDHDYERIKPQKGITYFVMGGAGKLRLGDIRQGSPLTAKGFDTDYSFMLVDIKGDEMRFWTINRLGQTVDTGTVARRQGQGARTVAAKPGPLRAPARRVSVQTPVRPPLHAPAAAAAP